MHWIVVRVGPRMNRSHPPQRFRSDVMAKLISAACVALLAGSFASTHAVAATPGEFRWARGTVISSSTDAFTLQLKGGSLTLRVDPATEVIPIPPIEPPAARSLPGVGSVV